MHLDFLLQSQVQDATQLLASCAPQLAAPAGILDGVGGLLATSASNHLPKHVLCSIQWHIATTTVAYCKLRITDLLGQAEAEDAAIDQASAPVSRQLLYISIMAAAYFCMGRM